MSCQLCTQGFVFDLVWTGKHWNVEEIGKCTCYGGTAEPKPELVSLAKSSGRHINIILLETLIKNLECHLTLGRQPSEGELNKVLATYKPEEPVNSPQAPATPAKAESGTQVCPEPESAPDYDFGDGWVPEPGEESVPF